MPPSIPPSLRLREFLLLDQIVPVENWEYMDEIWVGEAAAFTDVLQPEHDPERTRGVSIDLAALEPSVAGAMLNRLALPQLHRGLSPADADLPDPAATHRFVEDRISYTYRWPESPVELSCTFHNDEGLIFVTLYDPTGRIPIDE